MRFLEFFTANGQFLSPRAREEQPREGQPLSADPACYALAKSLRTSDL